LRQRIRRVKEGQLETQGVLNVRRLIILSAVATASLAAAAMIFSDASAQAPRHAASQSGSPGRIALVDIQYIFKHHPRFKQQMEQMRKDVESAEAEVQKRTGEIRQRAQQLEQYKGTRDFKMMEQEIADLEAKLAVDVRMQKREFLQREAKIYHNTYREILQAVDYFCRQNGIAMVMRFNGDPADTENPQEVLRDINKPIVWHQNSLDITPRVLEDIDRGSGAAANPNAHRPQRGPSVPFRQ
jgi:Skp family chaperone for outer membrane proteins